MSAPHAVIVDRSPITGSLASCVCGWSLGPFQDYKRAKSAAAEHGRNFAPPQPLKVRTPEERARSTERARALRAARRQAKAEGRP